MTKWRNFLNVGLELRSLSIILLAWLVTFRKPITLHHNNWFYSPFAEFVDGGTLRALIKDTVRPLPWDRRLQIAHDVTNGMAYLHSKEVGVVSLFIMLLEYFLSTTNIVFTAPTLATSQHATTFAPLSQCGTNCVGGHTSLVIVECTDLIINSHLNSLSPQESGFSPKSRSTSGSDKGLPSTLYYIGR